MIITVPAMQGIAGILVADATKIISATLLYSEGVFALKPISAAIEGKNVYVVCAGSTNSQTIKLRVLYL